MKMSKYQEFSAKSEEELNAKIVELKKELFNLRFQAASGELENTARFRQVRRDVARAKTALAVLKENKAAA